MRKNILTIVLCFLLKVGISQTTTPIYLQQDKLLHFGFGYMIGSSATVVADVLGSKQPFVWGIVTSSLASVGKEYYDHRTGGTTESMDMVGTVLGGITGSVIIPIYRRRNF